MFAGVGDIPATGPDTIDGGDGNDTILGNVGNDSLIGGTGNDYIDGAYEDDTILGGEGDDTLYGGDGVDLFIVEDGFGNDVITGGEGGVDFDTIDLSGLSGPATVTYTGDEAGTITDGIDTITFSEIEKVILTNSDDVVDGHADSASMDIDGGSGSDTIVGWNGADSISGGSGDDYISGGSEDDTVYGGDGNDTIDVGAGNDLAFGDAGNDLLIDPSVGNRASTLHGGTGDDTIVMGIGNVAAEYYGDDDADTFVSGTDLSRSTIEGGEGGVDFDTIDLSGLSGPATVTYTGDEAGTITDGIDTITFSGIEKVILTNSDDVVDGTADSASMDIDGDAGNDSILGGAGNDTLYGGDGNDTLLGGANNDLISGDSGADSLSGGDGNDTIFGDLPFEDFNGTPTGWVDMATGDAVTSTYTLNTGDNILGRFGTDAVGGVEKTFDLSPDATEATINFDFVKLDTWDEAGGGWQ